MKDDEHFFKESCIDQADGTKFFGTSNYHFRLLLNLSSINKFSYKKKFKIF